AIEVADPYRTDIFLVEQILDADELAESPVTLFLVEAGTPGCDGVAAGLAVFRLECDIGLAVASDFQRGGEATGLVAPRQLAEQRVSVGAGNIAAGTDGFGSGVQTTCGSGRITEHLAGTERPAGFEFRSEFRIEVGI